VTLKCGLEVTQGMPKRKHAWYGLQMQKELLVDDCKH